MHMATLQENPKPSQLWRMLLTGVAAQLEGVETGSSLGDLQLGSIMWVTTLT